MTVAATKKQQIIERRRRVADLRLSGVRKQQEVADRLGVSIATINRDFAVLDDEWRARAASDIDLEKSIDLDRIDQMIMALWPAASSGLTAAVDRVLSLINMRAKILGTEAPKRNEITGDAGAPLTIQIQRITREVGE